MTGPAPLRRGDLAADPLEQLGAWLAEGRAGGEDAGATMVVATLAGDGTPRLRTLPLRRVTTDGLEVHTDLGSDKGDDLRHRADATSALFVWRATLRQVRLECRAVIRPPEDADAAFAGRDRAAQLRAWTLVDRRPVPHRAELEARVAAATASRASDDPILRPPTWAVVVLVPRRVEVWQADRGAAHDRFAYERDHPADPWSIRRLAP